MRVRISCSIELSFFRFVVLKQPAFLNVSWASQRCHDKQYSFKLFYMRVVFYENLSFLFNPFACRLRFFLCRNPYVACVPRLRTTGRGYMQAGFPKIIRKTLSVKTNSLMKRTRKTLSCLHIAAVVYRAVFPPCLSSVYSFLEFRCFSVFLRFFSV